jgi:hypothetical protein
MEARLDYIHDEASRQGRGSGVAFFDKFLASHLASLRLGTEHATLAERRNGKARSNRARCTRHFLAGKFRFVVVVRTEKKKKQRRGRQHLLREAI